MEHPIEMDDLGVPLFSETAIFQISFGASLWKAQIKHKQKPQRQRSALGYCTCRTLKARSSFSQVKSHVSSGLKMS